MPVTLYLSNDLQQLADLLSAQIRDSPLGPFGQERLVVQTEGMRRWLSVKIAKNNGISAQMSYYSPDHLLRTFLQLAGLSTREMITPAQLRWVLYDLLEDPEFTSTHPAIVQYYRQDPLKRLQLATAVADLYDQYTVYRPEFIVAWNAGAPTPIDTKDPEKIAHAAWQRDLWLRSRQKLQRQGMDMDKTTLGQQLEKSLDKPEVQEKIRRAFPRIYFFGLSTFTRFHLQLFLRKISKITQVNFYFINPAPESYWYHDISERAAYWIKRIYQIDPASQYLYKGNPLLMNWGRTAKELMAVFFGELAEEVQLETLASSAALSTPPSLLATIQSDIYHNILPETSPPISPHTLEDGSIAIAAHYTIYREVEGLYDHLMHLMEKEEFKPHEMVVLTPDIDLYAPFIHAVFNNVKDGKRIPYSIADRNYHGMDNPIGVLQGLLHFGEEDFTSEGIIQLLESDFLRINSGIQDLEAIRQLIRRANIRFGIHGDPSLETDLVSWSHGLEKMLLGYAMTSDADVVIPGEKRTVLPLSDMEGATAREGLLLVGFIRTLTSFIRRRSQQRTLKEWREYTLDLIDQMMFIPDTFAEEYNYILLHLDALETISQSVSTPISYEVFARGFSGELFANEKRGKLISGKLTFSGMIPMRTIPYRVIALLGMNREQFPRPSRKKSFDLQQIKHHWGDRDIKEFDKYLFLETLIAAKDHLYISYLGQSAKDHNLLPPSSLVDQLMEYISRRVPPSPQITPLEMVQKALLVRHAIHHFNQRYYDPSQPQYYTYLDYGHADPPPEQDRASLTPTDLPPQIKDLKNCFSNPIKYYFNRTLSIYLNPAQVLLPESEPFEINSLERYQINRQLLRIRKEEELEGYIKEWKQRGLLPLKNTGLHIVKNLFRELLPYRQHLETLLEGQAPEPASVAFITNQGQLLQEQLDFTGNNTYIYPCLSSDIAHHLVRFHIERYLIGASGDTAIQSAHFLYRKRSGQGIEDMTFAIPTRHSATRALEKILSWERNSLEFILPFYPAAAKAWWEALGKGRSALVAKEAFLKTIGGRRDPDQSYVRMDPYLAAIDPENIFTPFLDYPPKEGNLLYEIAELFFTEL